MRLQRGLCTRPIRPRTGAERSKFRAKRRRFCTNRIAEASDVGQNIWPFHIEAPRIARKQRPGQFVILRKAAVSIHDFLTTGVW